MAKRKKPVNQDTFIKFRCSTPDKNFLEAYAKFLGVDVSKVIRLMIDYFDNKMLYGATTLGKDGKTWGDFSADDVLPMLISGLKKAAHEIGCEQEFYMVLAKWNGQDDVLEVMRNASPETVKKAMELMKLGEKPGETKT